MGPATPAPEISTWELMPATITALSADIAIECQIAVECRKLGCMSLRDRKQARTRQALVEAADGPVRARRLRRDDRRRHRRRGRHRHPHVLQLLRQQGRAAVPGERRPGAGGRRRDRDRRPDDGPAEVLLRALHQVGDDSDDLSGRLAALRLRLIRDRSGGPRPRAADPARRAARDRPAPRRGVPRPARRGQRGRADRRVRRRDHRRAAGAARRPGPTTRLGRGPDGPPSSRRRGSHTMATGPFTPSPDEPSHSRVTNPKTSKHTTAHEYSDPSNPLRTTAICPPPATCADLPRAVLWHSAGRRLSGRMPHREWPATAPRKTAIPHQLPSARPRVRRPGHRVLGWSCEDEVAQQDIRGGQGDGGQGDDEAVFGESPEGDLVSGFFGEAEDDDVGRCSDDGGVAAEVGA